MAAGGSTTLLETGRVDPSAAERGTFGRKKRRASLVPWRGIVTQVLDVAQLARWESVERRSWRCCAPEPEKKIPKLHSEPAQASSHIRRSRYLGRSSAGSTAHPKPGRGRGVLLQLGTNALVKTRSASPGHGVSFLALLAQFSLRRPRLVRYLGTWQSLPTRRHEAAKGSTSSWSAGVQSCEGVCGGYIAPSHGP